MSTLSFPAASDFRSAALVALNRWPAGLIQRERRLALFGFCLLALLLPMAAAWAVDERMLRGANVWIKPMKFALSIAVLSLTSAWFAGHLPARQRAGRAMDWIVWLLIVAGSFELGYIALQAGLGQGSHHNVGDPWHAAMYALMGIGAILLTATQPLLAWQLYRHPDVGRPVAYRNAVLLGLVLTFLFGAGVGGLLSAAPPPPVGATVSLFGWALAGGDLRPAHFLGIHAEQLLPLAGFAAARYSPRHARRLVVVATLGYSALFAVLLAWGMGVAAIG